jgi:glutamine synthetase
MLQNNTDFASSKQCAASFDWKRSEAGVRRRIGGDMIDAYIELRMAEVARFEMTPYPVEFDMYYSV